MLFTSSILYLDPELEDFTVSYKLDLYIMNLIRADLFEPYGLAEKDKDIHFGVMINVEEKTETLWIKNPYWHGRKTLEHDIFFPYNKIKGAQDERTAYIDTFFEALEVILPPHGVPVESIGKVKAMVFEELKNNPDEYIYTPPKKANVTEVLKKLGYDADARTFNLPNGDMEVDP